MRILSIQIIFFLISNNGLSQSREIPNYQFDFFSVDRNMTFYASGERKNASDRNSVTLTDNDTFNVLSFKLLKIFKKQTVGISIEFGKSTQENTLTEIGERDYFDFWSLGISGNSRFLNVGKKNVQFLSEAFVQTHYSMYSGEQFTSPNNKRDIIEHGISVNLGLNLGLSLNIDNSIKLLVFYHPLGLGLGTNGISTQINGFGVGMRF